MTPAPALQNVTGNLSGERAWRAGRIWQSRSGTHSPITEVASPVTTTRLLVPGFFASQLLPLKITPNAAAPNADATDRNKKSTASRHGSRPGPDLDSAASSYPRASPFPSSLQQVWD